jgi:general secretion pathway protein B
MSYILEALKKSQQERELGRVPRLQSMPFDEPAAASEAHPWLWVSLGLAAVAAGLALYAALRAGMAPPQAALEPAPSAIAQAAAPGLPLAPDSAPAPAAADPASGTPTEPAAVRGGPDAESTAAASADEAADAAAPSLAVSDENDLSVEPQVLVVPAPPKPGQRLPRGADELRRAVLGPDASPSISVERPRAPPRRQAAPPPVPETTPVPDDLIADIEAFKQQIGGSGDRPRRETGKSAKTGVPPLSASAAAKAAADAPAPPPSAALRRRLPDFAMSVHVYDVDPGRRFVYINGRKVRENQTSREGLRVENVRADGAVLSWDGERFFQPR